MTRLLLIFLSFGLPLVVAAQNDKNYILELNGDTISLSLNEPASLKTRDGKSLTLMLRQKDVLTFTDEYVTFQYPAYFTVSKKNIEGVIQLMCIGAGGNGFIIQEYKSINPENLIDAMLEEITEESKSAGAKETKIDTEKVMVRGRIIKGKQSTLQLDDDLSVYAVYSAKIKKGGIMIITMINDKEDEKEMQALNVFWKTLETKN